MQIISQPTPGASYTDEQAQDAVGNILADSATVDFTYDDVANTVTAIVKDASIVEAKLFLSDITTQNVSTIRHGFVPKAPNIATQYLDGTGAWSTPATGGGTSITNDGAKVSRVVNQSIANATLAAVIWDTEILDQISYWDSGQPTRVTIPQTGWYTIAANITWQNNSNRIRDLNIRLNGTDYLIADRVDNLSTYPVLHSLCGVFYLAAGDYLELILYQDSTSALTITGNMSIMRAGGSGALNPEDVQDIVGAMLISNNFIKFFYNDASNTMTAETAESRFLLIGV